MKKLYAFIYVLTGWEEYRQAYFASGLPPRQQANATFLRTVKGAGEAYKPKQLTEIEVSKGDKS